MFQSQIGTFNGQASHFRTGRRDVKTLKSGYKFKMGLRKDTLPNLTGGNRLKPNMPALGSAVWPVIPAGLKQITKSLEKHRHHDWLALGSFVI